MVIGARGGGGGVRRRRKLAGFESLLPVKIVDLALLRVAEDIIGFGDSFEFGLRLALVVGVLVGVPYAGEPLVRFLQIVVAGVAIHFQYVVVVHAHNGVVSVVRFGGGSGGGEDRWDSVRIWRRRRKLKCINK